MNLLVFDIDNTLIASENQHQTAFVQAIKSLGIPEINQNWLDYMHLSDSYILKYNYENHFKKEFSLDIIPSFETKMIEILKNLPNVQPIKGADILIENLRNSDKYAIAFATGSLQEPAIQKLTQSKIWFDSQLISHANKTYERENIVKNAIEYAKHYYKVSNFDKILSIGDGIWDYKTAKNLEIPFLGVGAINQKSFQSFGVQNTVLDWENVTIPYFDRIFQRQSDLYKS